VQIQIVCARHRRFAIDENPLRPLRGHLSLQAGRGFWDWRVVFLSLLAGKGGTPKA
jgi:hypothetical protein